MSPDPVIVSPEQYTEIERAFTKPVEWELPEVQGAPNRHQRRALRVLYDAKLKAQKKTVLRVLTKAARAR